MPENYITISGDKGNICVSENVLAAIVCSAVSEVEDIAALSNTSGSEIYEFLGKRSSTKGIRVSVEDGISVDVFAMVRFGKSIAGVGAKVQEAVSSAVESMTGVVPQVNVHIAGIAFEK